MKRFLIVRHENGVEKRYPMKQWIRDNPTALPGIDPTVVTSHKVRAELKKRAWVVQETETEVLLYQDSVLEAFGINAQADDLEDEEPKVSFALEYQLRDFLAENLESIDVGGKRLKVYVDPTGRDGVEFATDVGYIDLLAVDDDGAFVVFELKRTRSADRAIGQLARYMGWVKQTIGKDRPVRGVIVAKQIGKNLQYAVHVVPNVSLFEYEVRFTLKQSRQV